MPATSPPPAPAQLRQAQLAYQRFHPSCFWSYDPNYQIAEPDIAWVAQQLRKHGGWEAWDIARKLCP